MSKRIQCTYLIVLFVVSCQVQTPVLEAKKLFSIGIGAFEHQLDVFLDGEIAGPNSNKLFARNGSFFVSNAKSSKIVEFDQGGTYRSLVYNTQKNPKPILFEAKTKFLSAFDFQIPGNIVVDNKGYMYVDDINPDLQKQVDPSLGLIPDHVVLRFSNNGKLVDYIGQEGIGSSPFPLIQELYLNSNDELFVVCQLVDRYLVYWFDTSLKRKLRLDIPRDIIPLPDDRAWQANIASVHIDPDRPLVHVQIEYFPDSVGRRTETRIYQINLANARWDTYITLPYEVSSNDVAQSLYTFYGVAQGGYFYLSTRVESAKTNLMVLDRNGRLVGKKSLHIPDAEAVMSQLSMSLDGTLNGLFVFDKTIDVLQFPTQRNLISP